MALIKCPECGNMISTMAKVCIHCGCPIEELNESENMKYNVILYESGLSRLDIMLYLEKELKYNTITSSNVCNNLPYMIIKNISRDSADKICQDINAIGGVAKKSKYNPGIDDDVTKVFTEELRCPHCGSTQVSTGKRGATFTMGFIGSNKTVNRCCKCGYSWQP